MTQLLPLILLFVIMYFVLIRPQQQRQKAQRVAQSQIADGDQVLSSGGIYGRVTQVANDKVWVEIAPDIEVIFAKTALSRLSTSLPEDDFRPDEDVDLDDRAPDDLSQLDLGEHHSDGHQEGHDDSEQDEEGGSTRA